MNVSADAVKRSHDAVETSWNEQKFNYVPEKKMQPKHVGDIFQFFSMMRVVNEELFNPD